MWTITGPGKNIIGIMFSLIGLWIVYFAIEKNYNTTLLGISIGFLIELWIGIKLIDLGLRSIANPIKK